MVSFFHLLAEMWTGELACREDDKMILLIPFLIYFITTLFIIHFLPFLFYKHFII